MKKEYTVIELCEHELNGIDEKTFRRNKKMYIQKLEEKYYVAFGKRGRFTTYILEPKEKAPEQIENEAFLEIIGCDIGRKDIELMKLILKALLEKKVTPVQNELLKLALQNNFKISKSRGTIKNYMKFLRDNQIIIPPREIPVWDNAKYVKRECDPETGEIFPTYYKKLVRWVYFDYRNEGSIGYRKRLNETTQKAIHEAFKTIYKEEYVQKIVPLLKTNLSKEFISDSVSKLKMKVLQELGEAYGINACRRVEEPIINPLLSRQLKEYFGLNEEQKQRVTELDIDVSHIEVVNINRPVGISMSELEQMLEYKKLINERVQLYKEKESALPLEMYEKWHGIEFEQQLMKGITEINSSENSNDFNEANDSAVKVNEDNHVVDTCDTQDDFKKQLAAFKFKSNKTVNDGTNLMLSAFLNKEKGA
ncbi:hypothetical protein [Priestia megaterium]|uniref:hypothetical protein n=1 Tax=Priestia megaterium TaxID=1404 RepID=UPI0034574B4A